MILFLFSDKVVCFVLAVRLGFVYRWFLWFGPLIGVFVACSPLLGQFCWLLDVVSVTDTMP